MKYLVIDVRDGGDFSLDLIFAGLVKAVGHENVFDFPHKRKHREWHPQRADWGMERRTHGYTPDSMFVSSDIVQITSQADAGNLTVIMDEREESFQMYKTLGLFGKAPVVIVAGHDRFWNQSPEFVQKRLGKNMLMMFLDDWVPEYDNLPWARLINLSINYDHFWERPEMPYEKKYDIFFYGYNSHPDRARFVDHLLSHPSWSKLNNCIMLERQPDTVGNFILKRDYFKLMAESKICLNLRGASANGRALRLYEIPYVGSYMLSQTYHAKQLNPFLEGLHCSYFSNTAQLDAAIWGALNADAPREAVARNAHSHAMKNHTCEARARYLLKEIGHL